MKNDNAPKGRSLSGRRVFTEATFKSRAFRGEPARPPTRRRSRHPELEVVALRAEVLRRAVHHVAIRAVQFRPVVGRHVRIRGFHALCLFDERVDRMTARTGRKVRSLGIRLVRAVAGFAFDARFGVALGTEFSRLRCGRQSRGRAARNRPRIRRRSRVRESLRPSCRRPDSCR